MPPDEAVEILVALGKEAPDTPIVVLAPDGGQVRWAGRPAEAAEAAADCMTFVESNACATGLPGGSFEQLADSIRTQIYSLPDDTVVLPGHGPRTTVGDEKESNPFVAAAAR